MNSVATVDPEPTALIETPAPLESNETPVTPDTIKSELAALLATTKLYPNPKVAAVASALQPYKEEIDEIYEAGCNARVLADKMAKLLQIVITTKAFMEFLRVSGSRRALDESTKAA